MGSPETCPTCYGGVRNRPGNVSTEGTRVQLCDDPWHATPTPPAPADDAGAAERAVGEALRSAQALIRHLSQGIAGLVHADDDAERLYFVPKIVAAYGEFNEVATKIDAALRGTKGGAA